MSEKIIQKIARIKEYLELLKAWQPDCHNRLVSDALYRGALLHYLYLVADGCIALAEMVIREKKLRPPQTYRESIARLGQEGFFEPDFIKGFAGITGFRNFLAHDYENLDLDLICKLLERIPEIEFYLATIERIFQE